MCGRDWTLPDSPLLGGLLDLLGVGDRQVVPHHLQVLGHAGGELDVAVPVILSHATTHGVSYSARTGGVHAKAVRGVVEDHLVEGVLNGHDGEVLGQGLVEVAQLLPRDLLTPITVLVLDRRNEGSPKR